MKTKKNTKGIILTKQFNEEYVGYDMEQWCNDNNIKFERGYFWITTDDIKSFIRHQKFERIIGLI